MYAQPPGPGLPRHAPSVINCTDFMFCCPCSSMIGGAVNPQETDKPVVLIPVMAEDVARERRRKIAIRLGVGLLVAVVAFFAYRRMADPRDAREAYDAGVRL